MTLGNLIWIDDSGEPGDRDIQLQTLACSQDSKFNLCETDAGAWLCLLIGQQQCN